MKKDKIFLDRHGNQLRINDIVDHHNPDTHEIKSYLVERIDQEHITLIHKGERLYLNSINPDDYQKEGNIKTEPELVKEVVNLVGNSPHKNKLKIYHVELTLQSGNKIIEKIMASSYDEALDRAMPTSFVIVKDS